MLPVFFVLVGYLVYRKRWSNMIMSGRGLRDYVLTKNDELMLCRGCIFY